MQKQYAVRSLLVLFCLVHLSCLLAFVPAIWESTTATVIWLGIASFLIRKFAITAGYHRYFSHRSFKTSRVFQFILAWLGASAAQKGVLWWASTHRHHHLHSDQDEDVHSPRRDGFWWSHIGWVISSDSNHTKEHLVRDWVKYPELVWLERFHLLPFFVLAGTCYLIGGIAGVLWGAIISTVVLYHTSFAINSFCHIIGKRRYATTDDSRNSLLLALVTLGEGWHNNHHYYQASAAQGFYWWEIDISYYVLKLLSFVGIVWDIKRPPKRVLELGRKKHSASEAAASLEPVPDAV